MKKKNIIKQLVTSNYKPDATIYESLMVSTLYTFCASSSSSMASYKALRSFTIFMGSKVKVIWEKPQISEKRMVTDLKYSDSTPLWVFNISATCRGTIWYRSESVRRFSLESSFVLSTSTSAYLYIY